MIDIQLGDRTLSVHYDLGSLRDLERAMGGKPLASILSDLANIGIDALAIALYHGAKGQDPTLNSALILKMMDKHLRAGESLQPLFRAVNQALEETGVFRTSEDVSEGKQKTPALT